MRGFAVSLGNLRQVQLFQCEIRNRSVRPFILFMQPFQFLKLALACTSMVRVSTIIRLLSNANLPNRINPGHPLTDQHFNLAQLGDNLFRTTMRDSDNFILPLLTIPVDQSMGGGLILD